MKLRRIITTAAVAALTAASFAAPAQAQGLKYIDKVLDNLTCGQVFDRIHFLDLYEEDHDSTETTRNELAQNISELSLAELSVFYSDIFSLGDLIFVQSQTAEKTADKALECGFVAEDPTIAPGSSQLLNDLPVLASLSSEFFAR